MHAAVPEATASTCSACRYSAIRSSSSAAFRPVVSQPEPGVGDSLDLLLADRRRLEAQWCLTRRSTTKRISSAAARALERHSSALADCDHGAGPVGPAPERAEDVAGLPVGADVAHALDRVRELRP